MQWHAIQGKADVFVHPVMQTPCTREQIEAQFGPPHYEDPDNADGNAGPTVSWLLAYTCGFQCLLELHEPVGFVSVFTNDLSREHILRHLHFLQDVSADQPSRDWDYFTTDKAGTAFGCDLIRIDDNGCRFTMFSHLTQRDAHCRMLMYTARGHKQYYEVTSIEERDTKHSA